MFKVSSPVYYNKNSSFFESSVSDEMLDPISYIKNKIKNDPKNREKLRRIGIQKGIIGSKQKISQPVINRNNSQDSSENASNNQQKDYSGEKLFIKNKGKNPIVIDIGEKTPLIIKHFVDKRRLDEKVLNHPSLISLYSTTPPIIEDITEQQYWDEKDEFDRIDKEKNDRIERIREMKGGDLSSSISSSHDVESPESILEKYTSGNNNESLATNINLSGGSPGGRDSMEGFMNEIENADDQPIGSDINKFL